MRPEDIRKLLGGWPAGTLTEAERKLLLEAALEDQDLFNSMVAEQPLKDLLEDPSTRAELLAALDEPKPRRLAWLFRPWPLAAAGTLAATAVVAVVLVNINRTPPPAPPQMVAETRAPQAPSAPVAVPQPKAKQAAVPRKRVANKPAPPPAVKEEVAELEPRPSGAVGGVIGGFAAPSSTSFRASFAKSAAESKDSAAAQPFTYRVLRREGQNEFREAPAGTEFGPGDAVVLSIEAVEAGEMRVFESGAAGALAPLTDSMRIEPGGRYTIPRVGIFEFGGNPKDRLLVIRFTLDAGGPARAVSSVQVLLAAKK